MDSHDDAEAPYVDLMIVSLPALCENLGCDVVGCPTKRSSPIQRIFALREHQGSEAKVANLHVHVVIEEDVAHLQVAMDDVLAMEIFDGPTYLDHESADFRLGQELPLLDHLHQRAVVAELQDHKSRFAESEGSMELDDVRVMHLGVDLELCFELDVWVRKYRGMGFDLRTFSASFALGMADLTIFKAYFRGGRSLSSVFVSPS